MEAESFLDFSDVEGGVQNRSAHPQRGVVGPLRGGNPHHHSDGESQQSFSYKAASSQGGGAADLLAGLIQPL